MGVVLVEVMRRVKGTDDDMVTEQAPPTGWEMGVPEVGV